MDRIWLKNYPPGVPSDIDPSQYPSLVALFEESFRKFKDRHAYACMDKRLTYGELDALSRALGAWLQSKGFGSGRSRCGHAAQRPAEPGVHRRHSASRLRGG